MHTDTPLNPKVLYWPVLLVSLAFGVMAFSLPVYARALGSTAVEIGGLFSIFFAATMIIRPFVGSGLDRFGRKPFFILGLAGYALAMAALAIAGNLTMLYLARLFQGIASSLMWISAYTIAADLASDHERGTSIAWVDSASSQGALYGSFPGFLMFSLMSPEAAWPVLFKGYALLALLGAFLAWRRVPETRPLDPPTREDNLQPSLHPDLYRLMIVVFLTGMAYALIAPIWLVYLQDRFTDDTKMLAITYLPAALVYGFLPVYLGKWSDRLGRAPMMAAGLFVAALISLLLPAAPGLLWMMVFWIVEAVGFVMAMPAEEALVADLTGRQTHGLGYGLYTFASGLGATIGPLLGGWVYDHIGAAAAFYANGALLILCAGLVWLFFRRFKPHPQVVAPADDSIQSSD